jgi:hypothetical protein
MTVSKLETTARQGKGPYQQNWGESRRAFL